MAFESSWRQDREFGEALVEDQDFIDSLGERYLAAEDVYGEDVLREWAEDNGAEWKEEETDT